MRQLRSLRHHFCFTYLSSSDSSFARISWLTVFLATSFFLSSGQDLQAQDSPFDAAQATAYQRAAGGIGQLGGSEPSGQYPSPQYYIGLEIYRSGDLERAVDVLESALRGSRRDINGRWIDAIPPLAMLAECYWLLGDLGTSKQYVDQAFQIAIRSRGWLGRSDFASASQGNVLRSKPSWLWPAAASVNVVPFSNRIPYRMGDVLTEQRLAQGGTIQEQSIRPIDIVEIMRTLAVASHRRRIMLGPLAKNDPVASSVLDSTKYPANVVPVGRTLINAMRTVEYFSGIEDKRVIENAMKSAMAGGSAHPLTPVVLMSQAQTVSTGKEIKVVLDIASAAANTAAALEQPEWIGEAMQLAAGCADTKSAAAVAKTAGMAAIATRRQSRLASLHCLVAAADASVTAGDLTSASAFLSQARDLSARRDVLVPRLDAYGAYVAARITANAGSSLGSSTANETDRSVAAVRDFALNHRSRKRLLVSMPRLFQMGLIRSLLGTSVAGKSGDALLASYSKEPPIAIWRRDPVDALATCMADRSALRIARVELAAAGGYSEPLLIACDDMLAGRFLDQLPIGGRIAHVRTLVSRDTDLLPADAVAFRDNGGPAIKNLLASVGNENDPTPASTEAVEASATALALDRIEFPSIAIPSLDSEKPVSKLSERTGMLTFVSVGNRVYGCMASDGKVVMWDIPAASRLPGEIARLLKAIGVGKNRGKRIAEDEQWKEAAVELRKRLIPNDSILSNAGFDSLIVVPDGPLWYLPMEILPIADAASPLLGEKMSVRYAATPGLAIKPVANPSKNQATGFVSAKFFSPREPEIDESIQQGIVDVMKQAVRLPTASNAPSSFLGGRIGHLVIAATQNANMKRPLLTNIAGYDRSSPYGTLSSWIRFPAATPSSVVLMGMRTPVDQGQMGDGNEVFTLLAGLQVAGVRDVLVSRWAVGGESSAILLRELTQELPFTGLRESYSRSRVILQNAGLDPSAEPLLARAEADVEGLSGKYPLFWAGYLVSSPQ